MVYLPCTLFSILRGLLLRRYPSRVHKERVILGFFGTLKQDLTCNALLSHEQRIARQVSRISMSLRVAEWRNVYLPCGLHFLLWWTLSPSHSGTESILCFAQTSSSQPVIFAEIWYPKQIGEVFLWAVFCVKPRGNIKSHTAHYHSKQHLLQY